MDKPFKVCVDGRLWIEKITEKFARRIVAELRAKGLNATYYYSPARGA